MSLKNGMIKNISLFFCAILFSCLLAELITYMLYKDKIAIFPRYVTNASYGIFNIRGNISNAHYFHKSIEGSWEFHINSKGMRSKEEYDYLKPDGLIRILVIGDSFTIGYEVNQDETYSAVLEEYLKDKDLDVEVINAGVSGFGTAEELIFFEQEGIKYDPDVLILGFFENDLTDNLRSDLYRMVDDKLILNKTKYLPAIKIRNFLNSIFFYRWLSEHSYLHNYLNNAATLLVKDWLERKNENAILISSDNSTYKNSLAVELVKKIYSIAKKNNVYFILLDIPTKKLENSFPNLGRLNYENICDLNLKSSDILKEYNGSIDLYVPHGHGHWSAFSHSIIAQNLGQILEEHLKKRTQSK